MMAFQKREPEEVNGIAQLFATMGANNRALKDLTYVGQDSICALYVDVLEEEEGVGISTRK